MGNAATDTLHPTKRRGYITLKTLGYYNGNFGPLEEMTVPMNDRSCYFGDGVYEATLVHNKKIFALNDHLNRFFNSAGLLRIPIPWTREELTGIFYDMIGKMDDDDLFLYWQLTRGTGIRAHQFPEAGTKPNLWLFLKPGKHSESKDRLKLVTTEDTRFFHCNIKTLNLLPNVMAAQKAEENGCGECVFHRGEIVTECAHSNISIIKDGIFKTHPTDHLILPGITRMHIIQICKENGIPVDETPFTLAELMDADEVIVSSSTKFCAPACEIDRKPVGGKATELVELIDRRYLEKFESETA